MLILAAGLAGCIPSIHPLYRGDDDVVFEPDLVGTWIEEDGVQVWQFKSDDTRAYQVVYLDEKGRAGRFIGRLVRLDGHAYLDLYPDEPDDGRNEFYNLHLAPMHTFMRVERVDDTLRFSHLDPDEVKRRLDQQPSALAHEREGDLLVFTASPEALQQFLRELQADPAVFAQAGVLRRAVPADQ
jgi:hypothetical protein